MKNIKEILENFRNKKILVLGDIILDKYIFGPVERISPEAPVPIIKVTKEKYVPGGAANVAANISSLGGKAVLFGVSGSDSSRTILINSLKDLNIHTDNILELPQRKTIQKIRVISQNQQLLRIDYEDNTYVSKKAQQFFIKSLNTQKNIDAIIISDYAKGTLTKKVIKNAITYANSNNIPIIIDPKPKHKNWYKNATLLTPNKIETEEILGKRIFSEIDFIKAGQKLKTIFNSSIIITAGALGMYLFSKDKDDFTHITTNAKEVYDVSGAGDTVVAALALALSAKNDLYKSAFIANLAAGISVGKFGTAQVSIEEIESLY